MLAPIGGSGQADLGGTQFGRPPVTVPKGGKLNCTVEPASKKDLRAWEPLAGRLRQLYRSLILPGRKAVSSRRVVIPLNDRQLVPQLQGTAESQIKTVCPPLN